MSIIQAKGQYAMKRKRTRPSKKNMPKDLKRITNKQGLRVWVTGGKEYRTLREVAHVLKIAY